jgi:ketosteroid isomerase-like protein
VEVLTLNAEEAARRWIELYNDVAPGTYGSDRFVELYASDIRWRESPTPVTPDGRSADDIAAFREALEWGKTFFTDRNVTLHEIVADDDRAAMLYTWSATVAVDLGPDGAPVGARPRVEVATFLRVADGKIVEHTDLAGPATW